jgi:RNA polymerase sigma-70 factor, ECF subfamily
VEHTDPTFEEHRSLLLGLAYRLLGSMWDAEDVVQDAYLRWTSADRSGIREPRAFLITVVTHLALDQLRSARVTRTAYVGPWLPEPAATDDLGPMDTAELRDTVAFATLHLMERLSPPERAVFVLREAFDLPYDDITRVTGTSAAACRQTYQRARERLTGSNERFHPSRQDHTRLLTGFLEAAQGGDLSALTDLLADDVTSWTDGGGLVRQALRPIAGPRKVAAFWVGLFRRYETSPGCLVDVNGGVGLRMSIGRQHQVVLLGVREHRIHDIFSVLSPAKLTRTQVREPVHAGPPRR